ncbi:MAG: sugar phosphate isomerase/epimerase [Phycisphaerae bacterium]|nr:sugar phosphate isomerase/epimerase [Phycisphaerae bacterium]
MADATAQTRPARWKFGIMSNLLATPIEQTPATAKAWGFDGIEITLSNKKHVEQWAEVAFRKAFRERLADARCEVPSFCLGLLNGGNLGNESPEVAERAATLIRTMITAAPDVGARLLLVPFFGHADLKGPAKVDLLVDRILPLAEEATKAKISLALETTLPAPELLRLLARVGSPALSIYYDLANPVWQGYSPAKEIRELARVISQVHLKDNVADPTGWGGFRIVGLGNGRVDFTAAKEALRDIRFEGWLVMETAVMNGDHRTSAQTQLAFARRHFR